MDDDQLFNEVVRTISKWSLKGEKFVVERRAIDLSDAANPALKHGYMSSIRHWRLRK
jgi:hypothetical protein